MCDAKLPVSTSTKLFHDHIKSIQNLIRFVRGRDCIWGINTFCIGESGKGRRLRQCHDSARSLFLGIKLRSLDGLLQRG